MDISKLPRMSNTPAPPPVSREDVDAASSPPPPEAGFPVVTDNDEAQSQKIHCSRCGAANLAGSRFCSSCAAELRPPAAIAYADRALEGPGLGAEVWLSAIIGIALMLYAHTFLAWAVTTLTGGTFHTNVNWTAGPKDGQEVTYWELEGFTALQETAIFTFGFAMLLEAAVLAVVHSRVRSKRPLLFFALTITLIATALNLIVAGKLFSIGLLPLLSLLCIGFGGYIAAYEWRLLKHFRR
jgi:hypothetical protein